MASRKNKNEAKLSDDEKIVQQAQERFKYAMEWESNFRERFTEDIKFYYGDSENGYQWPGDVRKSRDIDKKPVLTINKTRVFCLQVLNEARQNKPAIKVKPVGEKASYEGAEVCSGIIRHIEYNSNAQNAYDNATTTQVQGGIGYWRVLTDYVDQDSFDQDIFIRPVRNAMSVLLDPDIMEFDGSDARYGFVYEDVAKDKFDTDYPKFKDTIGQSNLAGSPDWIDKDHIRVCEYYRRNEKKTKLLSFSVDGKETTVTADELPKNVLKELTDDPETKVRDVCKYEVEWFKIAGDQIVKRGEWAGSTIPLVRVVGEESIIENQMDRRGHVRMLKDPQRIYNYNSSASVEFVAQQGKIPWMGPAAAIEGYETYWNNANVDNYAYLPFKHVDDDGRPLPPPMKAPPPTPGQAYVQGLQIADQEMRMVTGQYESSMGEQAVMDRSGIMVDKRQRQGDNATFHFVDNRAAAIRYTGRIIVELIPKIYDTRRTLKILGQDGVESSIVIDPSAQKEYMEQKARNAEKINIVFNPGFAKYAVEVEVGPAYATRRQDAFAAFTQIMAAQPELMKVAGDLMFRAADFPMADELADRLKTMIPPEVLGKGPNPQVAMLLQQNQKLQQSIQMLMEQYAQLKTQKTSGEASKEIESYRAETERLKTMLGGLDPQQIAALTAQLVLQAMNTNIPPAAPANAVEAPALG